MKTPNYTDEHRHANRRSAEVDLRKTFAREQKRLAEQAKKQPPSNVRNLAEVFKDNKK